MKVEVVGGTQADERKRSKLAEHDIHLPGAVDGSPPDTRLNGSSGTTTSLGAVSRAVEPEEVGKSVEEEGGNCAITVNDGSPSGESAGTSSRDEGGENAPAAEGDSSPESSAQGKQQNRRTRRDSMLKDRSVRDSLDVHSTQRGPNEEDTDAEGASDAASPSGTAQPPGFAEEYPESPTSEDGDKLGQLPLVKLPSLKPKTSGRLGAGHVRSSLRLPGSKVASLVQHTGSPSSVGRDIKWADIDSGQEIEQVIDYYSSDDEGSEHTPEIRLCCSLQ